jgi:hypothetical protein
MAANKGGKPFCHHNKKQLPSLIAATGSSYDGIFSVKTWA